MKGLLKFTKDKFFGGFFFYSYLGYRIFLGVALSIFVGILDGFGLTMFLPLLQIADKSSSIDTSQLGKLSFLVDFLMFHVGTITIGIVLATMVIFFALKGLMAFVQFYYRINLQQRLLRTLRLEFIDMVASIKYQYFTSSETGRIQNTLTTEVERVTKAYQAYFMIIQNLIMVVVYLGFAYFVDAQFALLVTAGGFLSSLLYSNIYKSTKNTSRSITSKLSDTQGFIYQLIQNFKYLKATGRMKEYAKTLEKSARDIEEDNKKVGFLMAILNSSREPLVMLIVAAIIFLQTSIFESDLAPILVSLLFFYRALSFLMQMQSHSNYYLSVSGSIENMINFKTELMDNREETGGIKFNALIDRIDVKNGSFSIGDKQILKGIDFTVRKNETIAIVGESGSGKTTLLNLLTELITPSDGQLIIDGVDSHQFDKQSYRHRIGYISQEPVIFTDTIFNNVTFWDEKNQRTMARFNEAMSRSASDSFYNELPLKEDTLLGLNGMNLSGGQRQRISVARELYREVDLLIFDEATSSLDSATEKEIQQNIESLKGRYTIVIVAHRLATVRHADKVILMNNGNIESSGSFQELITKSKRFANMVQLQEISK